MSRTLKKLSAMILAVLMVVTMASVLVSAELKFGARILGTHESLTLGTSANYAKLRDNVRSTTDGSFFADSIALWGFNGITSYSPLSNQNGIDILIDPTLGISGGKWINKNIFIDLSAWSIPTGSVSWAKYGTKTITIGFNASASDPGRVLSWSKVPATGVNADKLLQFFTFKVDDAAAQIQLFDTDLTTAITATSGDNGVWNVIFQECTKTTFKESTPATPTVYTDDVITEGVKLSGVGYVYNMDGEVALWNDMFHGTHAYTKLFGFEYGVAGQTAYNAKDTNATVDFLLSAGTLQLTQWDIAAGEYKTPTTPVSIAKTSLDLSLLQKYFTTATTATPAGLGLTAGTYAFNLASWNAFVTMRNETAGYSFTVKIADPRIGTSTLVPTDATMTYKFVGLKGTLRLTWTTANAVTTLQTATAAGGENGGEAPWKGDFRIVGSQSQILTGSELEAGKLLYWEQVPYDSNTQDFGTTIQWPTNQNHYLMIVYKTTRTAQDDMNFDTKIRTLASEMNLVEAKGNVDLQLVPVIGGDDLIAGLKETDAKSKTLRDYGFTLNYYVDYTTNFMTQMTIDIHDTTLDNIKTTYGKANFVVKVTKGTVVAAYSCTITQYDETFVIPLQDGTFTLMRIKVKTNFDDKASPLADKDITEFNYSRLTMVEQVKLYNDRLVDANGTRVYNSNTNKVIYVDLINAIPGYGTTYYWSYNSVGVGTYKADGFNNVNYYTKLSALLSYVGFNSDGSKPVRNPVGYSKFYNTITDSVAVTETDYVNAGYDKADGKSGISLTPKQLWDTSFRMVYLKGAADAQESITLVYYPLTPAQTLKYEAADGNTYVYSLFFHTKYGDMPVAAASLGVAQKTDVKITKAGMYTYALGTIPAGKDATRENFATAAPTKDTGKGFAIGQMLKTETKGVISITNYWDNTRGLNNAASGLSNYNKAITILSVRIPAGATLAVSGTGTGVEAKIVGLEYGTLGLNTVDGLVDAYVTIEYSTVSDTAFTLTVKYNDAPDDGVKDTKNGAGFCRSWDVKTTWVVRTDASPDTSNAASVAYNKFASTLGKTLTPAAAVMPSNPNEAQVKSSTPSVTSTAPAPSATSTPQMGNPFYALAYIITIGASAIGGISTLIIRKRK